MGQSALQGKLIITATLEILTGLHIGAGNDFAPIGAVDSPFIRDPFTKQPIIPGSSIKGKMRSLLAKSTANSPILPQIDDEPDMLQRLFGAAGKNGARPSRLQFFDVKLTEKSFAQLDAMELDTYIGEIKFENTIDRLTDTANPRQIERVPAGAAFDFKLVYNIEKMDEVEEDMNTLRNGFMLLQMDYLGGHGSRGYGRVGFSDFKVTLFSLHEDLQQKIDTDKIEEQLKGSHGI